MQITVLARAILQAFFVPILVLRHLVNHCLKPRLSRPPSSPVALVDTPHIELGNAHVSNLARAKALLQIEYLGPCSIERLLQWFAYCFAQPNFREGYLVVLRRDILGLISAWFQTLDLLLTKYVKLQHNQIVLTKIGCAKQYANHCKFNRCTIAAPFRCMGWT